MVVTNQMVVKLHGVQSADINKELTVLLPEIAYKKRLYIIYTIIK
jgi:hypothetical protein